MTKLKPNIVSHSRCTVIPYRSPKIAITVTVMHRVSKTPQKSSSSYHPYNRPRPAKDFFQAPERTSSVEAPTQHLSEALKLLDSSVFNPEDKELLDKIVHACHEIDCLFASHSISLSPMTIGISSLKDLLEYLRCPTQMAEWWSGSESLGQQYLRGTFTPDRFEGILTALLRSVEKLQGVRDMLEVFEAESGSRQDEKEHRQLALWEAVEGRLGVLDRGIERLNEVLEVVDT